MKVIEQGLRWIFYHHGKLVTRYFPFFIVIPVVITLVLFTGVLVSFTKESDAETLYKPGGTQSVRNRVVIEDLYSDVVSENMLQRHRTRIGVWGQVIITSPYEDDGNVLQVPVMEEVLKLHDIITTFSFEYDGIEYRYTDLCLTWEYKCPEIELLSLIDYDPEEIENVNLTYPKVYKPSGEQLFIGTQLGGVALNDTGIVVNASAIMLTYNLRYVTDQELAVGRKWEKEFLKVVGDFQTEASCVYRAMGNSFSDELDESSSITIGFVAIVGVIVVCFSILSLSVSDWVRTKPLLACAGVVAASLALGSTFGLLSYLGVPYANVAGSAPFLVLGKC